MTAAVQYLNYRMLKKQLGLLESYLADSNTPDQSMIWLKLLFQRTLDGEISKLVDFYSMQVAELRAKGQELGHSEKERVLAVLNVRHLSSLRLRCSKVSILRRSGMRFRGVRMGRQIRSRLLHWWTLPMFKHVY